MIANNDHSNKAAVLLRRREELNAYRSGMDEILEKQAEVMYHTYLVYKGEPLNGELSSIGAAWTKSKKVSEIHDLNAEYYDVPILTGSPELSQAYEKHREGVSASSETGKVARCLSYLEATDALEDLYTRRMHWKKVMGMRVARKQLEANRLYFEHYHKYEGLRSEMKEAYDYDIDSEKECVALNEEIASLKTSNAQ